MPAPLLADIGPMSAPTQTMFAQSAVISGAPVTDAAITALLSDQPALFVNRLTNVTQK